MNQHPLPFNTYLKSQGEIFLSPPCPSSCIAKLKGISCRSRNNHSEISFLRENVKDEGQPIDRDIALLSALQPPPLYTVAQLSYINSLSPISLGGISMDYYRLRPGQLNSTRRPLSFAPLESARRNDSEEM